MPPVRATSVSTGSSVSKFTHSAPCLRAIASRSSRRSTAKTRPAPIIRAEAMANCPTGPAPKTATVSPSPTSAISAPNQPVGKMSEIRIACSSLTASGSFTSPTWAKGMRAFSACSPSKEPVASGPPKNEVPARLPLGLASSHWE